MKTARLAGSTALFAAILALGGTYAIAPALAVPDVGGYEVQQDDVNTGVAKHFQQGKALAEAGLWFPAEKEFQIVLDTTPDDAMANYYMGVVKVGKKETDAAIPFFSKAVENGKDMYLARAELGKIYAGQGKDDMAGQERDALKAMLDGCTEACTEKQQALDDLDAVMNGGSARTSSLFMGGRGGDVAYQAAVAEINREQYEKAITILQEAASAIGPHPDILTYLGFANRHLGRYDQALKYYTEALAINPEHKGAHEYLGEMYIEMGDMEKARAQLARLDELCPFACYQREELAHWLDKASAG